MGYLELLLIGVGLAMDAFAVSICKGLNMKVVNKKHCFMIACIVFWRISGTHAIDRMACRNTV